MNQLNEYLDTSPRSPLHTTNVNTWFKSRQKSLKKRHQNKVKKQYLLFPEQIKQEQEIQKIFQNFDRNNSKNLDITEMYDMFQKYGFKLTEEQLLQFFKVVDKDKNNALNWNEFKNSVFDDQASKIFYNIIKQVREQEQNESQSGYIPFNFNEMISYLNYLASRDELQKSIQQSSQTTNEKFEKYLSLLELNQIQIQSYNDQKLNSINQEERLNQNYKEVDFTKIYQNKYQSSKSSYLNGKDLPTLQKLKSEKNRSKNSLLKLNKSSESSITNLQNSQRICQLKQDNKSLFTKKSLLMKLNLSPINQKGSQDKPYLNLDFNKINQNYRENLQNQSQTNVDQNYGKSPDRVPISIIQELQKFQILSGQYRQQNIQKCPSDSETGQNIPKPKCSILRTSTEVLNQSKQVSPTNSKLCTPRQWRDEKYLNLRKSPCRQFQHNFSQYNQKEKNLDINLKGKSLLFK
ncbi:unnamed protein product [Paramecium sonneborni]|uniref:EF-hand domain-containing protein n=1 Tax=Paramecium sonneborni TaxID=65129 RepID=A0A8S1KM12_9CILI|nr:unnamed protein product [Paramecium sonneborni]